MKKKIYIEGMTCDHCSNRVKKTLEEVEKVKQVEVNLSEGFALIDIEANIEDSLLVELIDEAGYDVTKIEEVK